jgi:hypothetical protein
MAKSCKLGDVCIPKKLAAKHGTDLNNDALWEDWIRHYAITVYHPTSTCRMGDVVDEFCKVMLRARPSVLCDAVCTSRSLRNTLHTPPSQSGRQSAY